MNSEKLILLVEDNPDDVLLTIEALKDNNILNKIEIAKDGVEALDFIFGRGQFANRESSILPQLILLDLKLPKVDGLEVLKEIKANQITKMIPVVILTSSKEEQDLLKSYSLGVNSYIRKPVDFEQFSHSVKQLGLYWLVLNESPQSDF
jgi:two-component system, response regulator